jgi:PhnB protein
VARSPTAYRQAGQEHGRTIPLAINLLIYVEDVNATAKSALAAGATVVWPVEEQFHGDLVTELRGRFDHPWFSATRVEEMSAESRKERVVKAEL